MGCSSVNGFRIVGVREKIAKLDGVWKDNILKVIVGNPPFFCEFVVTDKK